MKEKGEEIMIEGNRHRLTTFGIFDQNSFAEVTTLVKQTQKIIPSLENSGQVNDRASALAIALEAQFMTGSFFADEFKDFEEPIQMTNRRILLAIKNSGDVDKKITQLWNFTAEVVRQCSSSVTNMLAPDIYMNSIYKHGPRTAYSPEVLAAHPRSLVNLHFLLEATLIEIIDERPHEELRKSFEAVMSSIFKKNAGEFAEIMVSTLKRTDVASDGEQSYLSRTLFRHFLNSINCPYPENGDEILALILSPIPTAVAIGNNFYQVNGASGTLLAGYEIPLDQERQIVRFVPPFYHDAEGMLIPTFSPSDALRSPDYLRSYLQTTCPQYNPETDSNLSLAQLSQKIEAANASLHPDIHLTIQYICRLEKELMTRRGIDTDSTVLYNSLDLLYGEVPPEQYIPLLISSLHVIDTENNAILVRWGEIYTKFNNQKDPFDVYSMKEVYRFLHHHLNSPNVGAFSLVLERKIDGMGKNLLTPQATDDARLNFLRLATLETIQPILSEEVGWKTLTGEGDSYYERYQSFRQKVMELLPKLEKYYDDPSQAFQFLRGLTSGWPELATQEKEVLLGLIQRENSFLDTIFRNVYRHAKRDDVLQVSEEFIKLSTKIPEFQLMLHKLITAQLSDDETLPAQIVLKRDILEKALAAYGLPGYPRLVNISQLAAALDPDCAVAANGSMVHIVRVQSANATFPLPIVPEDEVVVTGIMLSRTSDHELLSPDERALRSMLREIKNTPDEFERALRIPQQGNDVVRFGIDDMLLGMMENKSNSFPLPHQEPYKLSLFHDDAEELTRNDFPRIEYFSAPVDQTQAKLGIGGYIVFSPQRKFGFEIGLEGVISPEVDNFLHSYPHILLALKNSIIYKAHEEVTTLNRAGRLADNLLANAPHDHPIGHAGPRENRVMVQYHSEEYDESLAQLRDVFGFMREVPHWWLMPKKRGVFLTDIQFGRWQELVDEESKKAGFTSEEYMIDFMRKAQLTKIVFGRSVVEADMSRKHAGRIAQVSAEDARKWADPNKWIRAPHLKSLPSNHRPTLANIERARSVGWEVYVLTIVTLDPDTNTLRPETQLYTTFVPPLFKGTKRDQSDGPIDLEENSEV